MPATDHLFVLIATAILVVLLVASKVTRAILWETVAHPFTRSRISLRNGQIVAEREERPAPPTKPGGAAVSQSPLGARR